MCRGGIQGIDACCNLLSKLLLCNLIAARMTFDLTGLQLSCEDGSTLEGGISNRYTGVGWVCRDLEVRGVCLLERGTTAPRFHALGPLF